MTKDIIILILFLIILFLIYKTNKKKVKNFFYESKIKQINISELDKVFDEKSISKNLNKENTDNKISFRNIINESIYEKFLFSGTDVENKINIIFEDSINFDESKYLNRFDLIFIDGGHTYSIVKNDTEKSFKMINKNGIILWHDYVPGKQSAKNVVNYLNEISKEKNILNIRNTSLCVFRNSD